MRHETNSQKAVAIEWFDLWALTRYAAVSERTIREGIHCGSNPLPAVRGGTQRVLPTTQPNPTTSHRTKKSTGAVAPADWIPIDAWAGFVEMRQRIRAPLTKRAVKLIVSNSENARRRLADLEKQWLDLKSTAKGGAQWKS